MTDAHPVSARNYTLDLMRALCILYIVSFWHLLNYTQAIPGYNNSFTQRLTIVVLGLFTLLSGYLTGTRVNCLSGSEIMQFYKTRLLRIYPPFLLALVLFYFMGMTDVHKMIKTAVLISMFSAPSLPTLWFIVMVMMFYLSLPLLVAMSSDMLKYAITCILIIMAILVFDNLFHSVDIRIALLFPAFAIGVLLARKEVLLDKTSPGLLILLCAASVVISYMNIDLISSRLLKMPLALFGPLVIFVALMKSQRRIRYQKIIVNISYASYFMFLFHRPIFASFKKIFFPASPALQGIYLLVVCLPFIVAISWLGQKAYDQIILKYQASRWEQRSVKSPMSSV